MSVTVPVDRISVELLPVTPVSVIVNVWSASIDASGHTGTKMTCTFVIDENVNVPLSFPPNSPPPLAIALCVAEPGVMV